MPGSLLALLDDIGAVLDDIALLAKVAAKKSAGVMGDDLALNAQQVSGILAERELPVVWAIAAGSLKNKAVIIPAALALSAAAPRAVTPLLMLGGLFLCYEGFEKIARRLIRGSVEIGEERAALAKAVADPGTDLVAFESGKISGAVRTDFILSAEIIVITLGAVAGARFAVRVGVLVGVGFLMTVFVYGLVAAIVKLDDAGLYLSAKQGAPGATGRLILRAAPLMMKGLSALGTAAMFMVGGGILSHGFFGGHSGTLALDALVGIAAGAAVAALRAAGRAAFSPFLSSV